MKVIRILVLAMLLCLTGFWYWSHSHTTSAQLPPNFSPWTWWGGPPDPGPQIRIGSLRIGDPSYGLLVFATPTDASTLATRLSSFPGYIYLATEPAPSSGYVKDMPEFALSTLRGEHEFLFVLQTQKSLYTLLRSEKTNYGIHILSSSQVPDTDVEWVTLISQTSNETLKFPSNDSPAAPVGAK